VGVLSGFVVVGLVAFAPALPSLVGNAWRDVPAVLLWSGVALIVGMPITVATSGYLLAGNRVGTVATAMLASAVVWFGVAVLLLPRYGAPAVGVGWVIAALINAGLLWRRTAASTGAAIGRHAAGPTAVSLVAAIVSWLMARHIGPQLAGAVVALTVGELILLAGLATVSASALRDTHSLAREGIRSFRQSGVSHMRTSAAPRPTSSNLDVGPGARSSSAARDGGGPDP
jgi:hypothetical protein